MISATCHCGAVRIDMHRRPRSLTSCNCSVCRRYGAIWAYYARKGLDYHYASDAIVPYAWGNANIEFFHCRSCGCVTHYERTKKQGDQTRVGVNVRNVEPAELDGIPLRRLDGAVTWKTLGRWKHRWA
jgi:hypothetical protein